MQIEASQGPLEQLDVHAVAVAVFKDEKTDDGFLKKLDELSGGLVKSTIDAEEFAGKEGETAYFHLLGNDKLKARRLLLVGVGSADDYKVANVSNMAGTAVRGLRGKNAKSIAVVPRLSGNAEAVGKLRSGSIHICFRSDKYRAVDKNQKTVEQGGRSH